MTKAKSSQIPQVPEILSKLTETNFIFRGMEPSNLQNYLDATELITEKLYSSRPIYTAFRPNQSLDYLYAIVDGGPVVMRSTPLDRVIAMTYPGGCFGMRNLPLGFGRVHRSFPSLVEAYKTTDVVKIPLQAIAALYEDDDNFRERYDLLGELREKFHYHLLNCSAYPPQAVAALLRALIYQERTLGDRPPHENHYNYRLDLPVDIIAHACQLNHRTVEQVLKGMTKVGLIAPYKEKDGQEDLLEIKDPEALKEVYGATRSKVPWWPLR